MGSPVDRSIYRKIAHFLLEGHDKDAANLLLTCSLAIDWSRVAAQDVYTVQIGAPRRAYDILTQKDHPISRDIRRAFEAFLLPGLVNYDITPELAEHEDGWKADVKSEISKYETGEIQAADVGPTMWQGISFRSPAQVRGDQALDHVRALYLPNPVIRLGPAEYRETGEATFVVCHQGQWGVLQILKEHHPYNAAPRQYEATFASHGIRTIQRYFASKCLSDPDSVVQDFLGRLAVTA